MHALRTAEAFGAAQPGLAGTVKAGSDSGTRDDVRPGDEAPDPRVHGSGHAETQADAEGSVEREVKSAARRRGDVGSKLRGAPGEAGRRRVMQTFQAKIAPPR